MKQASCKLCGATFVCDNGMWSTTCHCARFRPAELKLAQEKFDRECPNTPKKEPIMEPEVMAPCVNVEPAKPLSHEEAKWFYEGFKAGATAYAAAANHTTLLTGPTGNKKLREVFDKQGWETLEQYERLPPMGPEMEKEVAEFFKTNQLTPDKVRHGTFPLFMVNRLLEIYREFLQAKHRLDQLDVPVSIPDSDGQGVSYLRLNGRIDLLAEKAKRYTCKARTANTGGNDPQDCNWPYCGCDPHADKVLEAVEETGRLVMAKQELKNEG